MAKNVAESGTSPRSAQDEPQRRSPAPALELRVAGRTDVGRARPHNEDCVDHRVPQNARQRTRKGSLFLVADGMGGHRAGEVASQGAVRAVMERYYDEPGDDVPTNLVRAFQSANQQIYDQAQADPSKAGMGTTLVAAVIVGRKLYVANVGDSRAYLLNNQGMIQITEDHSWVEEQVRAGLLTEEQARRHPHRNLVTRALGSKPSVGVDTFEAEIRTGDILLLCSDGLTNRVSDDAIAAIVQQHEPEEATRLLVATANEHGGNDNITVLIVSAERELASARAPAVAPSGQKDGRRLSLAPVLAGLVILLLVVVGSYYAWRHLGAGSSQETPVPSSTPSSEVTTGPPPLTATAGSVERATPTSSPAVAPSPTQNGAPGTATPSPTSQAPTPLATEQGSDPAATATPDLPQAPITLDHPEVGATLTGPITFTWTHHGSLDPEEGFQLLIWRADQEEELVYSSSPLSQPSHRIEDLDSLLSQGREEEFLWSVRIVRASGGEPITDTATRRSLIYQSTGG
jgi:serine/threonine protein phosphatase PrpC